MQVNLDNFGVSFGALCGMSLKAEAEPTAASVGIARRRAEPGWRAVVLDDRASRHAFRLRGSEEGSGF